MAFTNTSAGRNNRGNEAQYDTWKAQGFLNLYLPNRDGKRTKLGAIPLKEGRPNEKALIEWLKEDSSRVEIILQKLELEYRSSEPTEGSKFDLPI
jgi:hypothetical protein